MTTVLERAARVYEAERALWDVRQDKMTGMYQVVHHRILPSLESDVLGQLSTEEGAKEVMQRMCQTAAMHSALRFLSLASLGDSIMQAGGRAMDGADVNAARAFRGILDALCNEG